LPKANQIDEIDAKILQMLLQESRTSFTDMAKTCNVSVGAVRMRYARLKKIGVITGEIMQVNPHAIGYRCISDLGIKTAIDKETEVRAFLRTKPYLAHIVNASSNYNFWTKVILKDIKDLNNVIAELEYNPNIKRIDAYIWDEAINLDHPENLTITSPTNQTGTNQTNNHSQTSTTEPRIDKLDLQIAQILTKTSRLPFRKIGEQLGISTKNVIQRYKKLRQSVLPVSSIMVDLNKMGYCAWAHLFIKVANRSKMSETFTQILHTPNLIVGIRYIGAYDMYATVALTDYEELFQLTERFRRIKGIEQTDIFLGRIYPEWPINLFHFLLQQNLSIS
jgi:Lrp/AsnC family transcriptional regulator, regulator for asnA, asnC and gidA